jgi:hypothetical protein
LKPALQVPRMPNATQIVVVADRFDDRLLAHGAARKRPRSALLV